MANDQARPTAGDLTPPPSRIKPISIQAGARAWVAAEADVLSITESRHTLEDVYLELIDDQEARS